MSTIKSRLNISIPDGTKKALPSIAKRDQMPAAIKAVRLMEIGMEIEEDEIWNKIAVSRHNKNTIFHSHAEVFGS